jgi:hypothetical protein
LIDNERTLEAKKLTSHGFVIIPLNDKIAIIKYRDRRKVQATTREIDLWFSNGNARIAKANGIAIAINNTEFGIDTDGEKCESIFSEKIISTLRSELQNKIRQTMHTRTTHGHHRTFRILSEDFPKGIQTKTIVKFEGHNEIAIIGKDHILAERGPGYEILNDVDNVVTLSKEETTQFLDALDSLKSESNGIRTVLGVVIPHYKENSRHAIALALAGFLHKGGAPEHIIYETIERLASETADPEISDRLKAVKDTCAKTRNNENGKAFLLPIDVVLGWIFTNNKRQRIFNRISNTIVIKLRPKEITAAESVRYTKDEETL